jgi:phosphoribosylglycinamide formyltransferase-1
MAMKPLPRVAVLVSGEGSNLQALIDAGRAGGLGAALVCVVSNRAAARGLERARTAGIAVEHVGGIKGEARERYDARLAAVLAAYALDFIVLAGFMRIFSAEFVGAWSGRILNIHPSLLPAHPGLETHRRVLDAGDPWHGATVHFVTADLDAGPAVVQYRLRVRPADTVETLARRVHVGEHIILPRAVNWLALGRLSLLGSSVMLDGQPLTRPVLIDEEESVT